jgi:hypothetical protein
MTMTELLFSVCLGFVAGGALIWFGKTRIQGLVIDANTLSAKLHAQADAISAAASAIKKI